MSFTVNLKVQGHIFLPMVDYVGLLSKSVQKCPYLEAQSSFAL